MTVTRDQLISDGVLEDAGAAPSTERRSAPVRAGFEARPTAVRVGQAATRIRTAMAAHAVSSRVLRPVMPYLLPISAVVLSVALRMIDLGRVGLNSDEAVYAAQSASLAGNPHFIHLFPIVRAHPLLLQVLMSPLYRGGVQDVAGRYVTALFGIGTVALLYVLGRVLYDRRVGGLAALLLAVMPYHVTVSRQIMLDGPMAFFSTGALICLAVASTRPNRARWLVAAGACLGMAALSKESAFILIGSAFVFLSLVNHLWRPLKFPLAGGVIAITIALAYPVLTTIAGGAQRGNSYLLWQLTRHPNHSFSFYFVTVGAAMGFALVAVALVGLFARRFTGRVFTWRETLLLSWIAVPLLFFEVWPVKGFSYLMPLAPVVALLAARALCPLPAMLGLRWRRVAATVAAVACVASVAIPAVAGIARPSTSGLAGAGGLPGGREAGRWVNQSVPQGARFMTIGPSMANLIEYYSGRHSDGLSVSPNPLHRNPSYHPIVNADYLLKQGDYQYIVWDAYSARRSPIFSARALTLAQRYHGQIVDMQRGSFAGKSDQPLVVIYEVTP